MIGRAGVVCSTLAAALLLCVSCSSEFSERTVAPTPVLTVDIQATVQARVDEVLAGTVVTPEVVAATVTPVPTIDLNLIAQVILDNIPTPGPSGGPAPTPDAHAIVRAVLASMPSPLPASEIQAIVQAVLDNLSTPVPTSNPSATPTPNNVSKAIDTPTSPTSTPEPTSSPLQATPGPSST